MKYLNVQYFLFSVRQDVSKTDDCVRKSIFCYHKRFGKIANPVRMIPLDCKNIALKHVTSFRCHVFMFLNTQTHTLEVLLQVNLGENSYMIYASTENLRCFERGELGTNVLHAHIKMISGRLHCVEMLIM